MVRAWSPNRPKATWSEICDAMDRSAVQQLTLLRGVFQWRLSEAGFNMIYDGQSAMRLDGNEVAHEADQVLVRDAVIHAKPGESEALMRNIYGCIFGEDLG
jgi:hypothetical protein